MSFHFVLIHMQTCEDTILSLSVLFQYVSNACLCLSGVLHSGWMNPANSFPLTHDFITTVRNVSLLWDIQSVCRATESSWQQLRVGSLSVWSRFQTYLRVCLTEIRLKGKVKTERFTQKTVKQRVGSSGPTSMCSCVNYIHSDTCMPLFTKTNDRSYYQLYIWSFAIWNSFGKGNYLGFCFFPFNLKNSFQVWWLIDVHCP